LPTDLLRSLRLSRGIVPTIISQILSGQTKIKLGNLSPTRDLTFVRDTASAYLAIANVQGLNGEVTNVGTNNEISIGELAKLISELIGKEIEIAADAQRIRPDKSEVERLYCDNSKILKHTKWQPQYHIKDGIEETISWFRNQLNIYKPEIYNV